MAKCRAEIRARKGGSRPCRFANNLEEHIQSLATVSDRQRYDGVRLTQDPVQRAQKLFCIDFESA